MEEKEYLEKILKLELENIALKDKLKSVYISWLYDYGRFTELKEIYKSK